MNETSILTLSALARRINLAIADAFGSQRYWVVAEVIGMKISRGHCYLQLAEKDEITVTPKAEFRGIIWALNFERLHERFKSETGGMLSESMQILCSVEIQFHERYGLSLIIHDLDPSYTLGRLEIERRKTIERLKLDGVFDLNRNRYLPLVVQKVAVISAQDSRGYEDFIASLSTNMYGYKFNCKLYPSLLQGDLAAGDIIAKLISIYDHLAVDPFDAVIIIRGGGAASSLGCFNDYNLSRAVAKFPVPVITGIGHSANRSVVDEVANTPLITPTDAAGFLINRMAAFEENILQNLRNLEEISYGFIDAEKEWINSSAAALLTLNQEAISSARQRLTEASMQFRNLIIQRIFGESSSLQLSAVKIQSLVRQAILIHQHNLENSSSSIVRFTKEKLRNADEIVNTVEKRLRILDPEMVLNRGYSYTIKDGKVLRDVAHIKPGDEIKTVLAKGNVNSTITKINHG